MNNGRVIKIDEGCFNKLPMFYNNVASGTFKRTALKGIQQVSQLSLLFFSKENIDILQKYIRYNVWILSNKKHIIGRQSDIELEIVMRSMYLQHSRNLNCKIIDQIKNLNKLVVDWCAPKIYSEVQQYIGYLYDVQQLPMPIDRPVNISNKGSKTLKSVTTTF
jgi:hypothetical protein